MQTNTLKTLRTGLACLFFASVLVLALILKLRPMFIGMDIGNGTGRVVTSLVAIVSLVGWLIATVALSRRNDRESS